jgi:hypothetical protein
MEKAKVLGILFIVLLWLFTSLDAGVGFMMLIVFVTLAALSE